MCNRKYSIVQLKAYLCAHFFCTPLKSYYYCYYRWCVCVSVYVGQSLKKQFDVRFKGEISENYLIR